jgi:hypothetical protein
VCVECGVKKTFGMEVCVRKPDITKRCSTLGTEWKRELEMPRHRWEDNTKMDLK